MEKYSDIIAAVKNQQPVNPPESFTDNVMRRLPDQYPSILLVAASFVHHLFRQALALDGDQSNDLTRRECSFYFFITGFFYLIIGIVAMTGLKKISSGAAAVGWIGLQPHFAIVTAIWFFALGVVLMMDGSTGMKIAKYGTLLYIFLAIVNGMLIHSFLHIPYAGIFIFGLVGMSALMGVLLVLTVQKMEMMLV
jgi:hypothetical protein